MAVSCATPPPTAEVAVNDMGANMTIEYLGRLKLGGMAEAYADQMESGQYDKMSFEDRFALIVEAEYLRKKNNRIALRHRKAAFAQGDARIEDIDYSPDRELERDTILRLASCNYVKRFENILVLGASDSGKSFLGCALGNAACRHDIKVKYYRLTDLFEHLEVARLSGGLQKAFKELASVSVLVLDDFLLSVPTIQQAQLLVELLEKREFGASTIICSQLDPKDWHKRIDEQIQANCLYSRIVPAAHIIVIKGKPMRERYRAAVADTI
jgi:DNA replication protein DnaC